MSTDTYIPLSVRFTSFLKITQAKFHKARLSNPFLISLSRRTNRDPTVLLLSFLLILSAILLINPDGIAPTISNSLSLLPAVATLKHIDRPLTSSKSEQGKYLLDYWVCVGTSYVVEQIIGRETVGALLPLWWLIKGIAGLWVWMSIDNGITAERGIPKTLSLNTNKARSSINGFSEPEPSPSPVADCLSALLQGFTPEERHDESTRTLDASQPISDLSLTDPRSHRARLSTGNVDDTAVPPSPRDQLDAFLDSTASDLEPRFTYENMETEEYVDQLSPAFVLDGMLAETNEYVPLARLPGHSEALAGGPQAKDKDEYKGGKEAGNGQMSLDDLLESEENTGI